MPKYVNHYQDATQSLTVLNSEFSFSSTGCITMIKKISLPDYLPCSWIENSYLDNFFNGISTK